MNNKSYIGNYSQNGLKTHYKSPIKRKKSIDKLTQNITSYNNKDNNFFNRKNDNEIIYKENIDYENPILSSRNHYKRYNYDNNINNKTQKDPSKLNRSSSVVNYFKEKIKPYNKSTTRNSYKNNNLQRKARNTSVKNNDIGKAEKYFYKLICNNCYNNKIATKKLNNQPPEKKELLSKTFNKVNPFYFHDKMNDIHKNQINNKIKELENLQKQALDNLVKYKIKNPTGVEKLQKQNEFSINPLNSSEKDDPILAKIKKNYDEKEKFINNNKDLYQVNQPRKAINDYYNNCQYQVPVLEEEHHLDPEYKKEVNNELKKQIEDKNKNKKKEKDDQINEEKLANKKMNDYIEYLNKKNKEDKEKDKEDLIKNNKILSDYKKYKEDEEKENNKKYYDDFKKKIKEEEDKIKEKKRQKKINEMNKLQEWIEGFEKDKKDKKKEKENENNKWKHFNEEFNNKCKHGLDIYRCALCNKVFPKEKLIKYYCSPSSTDISLGSSRRSTNVK